RSHHGGRERADGSAAASSPVPGASAGAGRIATIRSAYGDGVAEPRQRATTTDTAVRRLNPACSRIDADRLPVRMASAADSRPSAKRPGIAITDPIEGLNSGWTAANASAETNAAHGGVIR